MALSKAHNLLTTRNWQGAELNDILSEQLAPYADDPARLSLVGEAVSLAPRAALTLSMVFHELATNAAKYGALSVPGGRLTVRWHVERLDPVIQGPSLLRLSWRESDGPPVVAPERRGFGSRLIERSTGELDGEAQLEFTASGFCYSLTIPLTAANSLSF